MIYERDGVLNPAQFYGEALTIGLTLDDIKFFNNKVKSISIDDVKKSLEELYLNKNYVVVELIS